MPVDQSGLLRAASEAAKLAYSPYSRFCVGAAVLTGSGKIFTGCNVENASYGLTVCAERVAVLKAISEGEKELISIAICSEGAAYPCGACRQVLHEFAPGLEVILGDNKGKYCNQQNLRDLLPDSFGPGFKKV